MDPRAQATTSVRKGRYGTKLGEVGAELTLKEDIYFRASPEAGGRTCRDAQAPEALVAGVELQYPRFVVFKGSQGVGHGAVGTRHAAPMRRQ